MPWFRCQLVHGGSTYVPNCHDVIEADSPEDASQSLICDLSERGCEKDFQDYGYPLKVRVSFSNGIYLGSVLVYEDGTAKKEQFANLDETRKATP